MRKGLVATVAAALLAGAPVRAEEHLLAVESARQRLVDAAASRERDLATLDALAAAADASVLAAAGLDAGRVRASLRALDDGELRELAARASALQADPAAGAAFTGKQVGIVAAVILIGVFIIIIA